MKSFTAVSSRDNAVIKQVVMLKSSADKRKKEGLFVLEGLRLCSDAFENNVVIERLIVSESAMEKYKNEISSFAEKSAACITVPDALMSKISDTKTPQGIMITVKTPLQENTVKAGEKRYIALENVQDPSNLGAIARTAEALGFGGIILSDNGCDPYSPKSLRASMGTLLRLPLFFTYNIIGFCNKNGLSPVACVVDSSACDIKEYEFCANDVLLIGNEANGLEEETVNSCEKKVTIRMSGKIESLNAAAAAAIAMWESCR